MNRSTVILKTIIIIWEVPGNDCPGFQHIYFAAFIVPSTLVKVPTPLYVMQPQIMTLIFLFTLGQTHYCQNVIIFSPNHISYRDICSVMQYGSLVLIYNSGAARDQ